MGTFNSDFHDSFYYLMNLLLVKLWLYRYAVTLDSIDDKLTYIFCTPCVHCMACMWQTKYYRLGTKACNCNVLLKPYGRGEGMLGS